MKKAIRAFSTLAIATASAVSMAGYQLQQLGNADPNLFYATYPQGGINASRQTSAFALFFGNFSESTAYRWNGSAWEALTQLPVGAFTAYGYGFGINDAGNVSGSDFVAAAAARRWRTAADYDILQPIAGRSNSEAFGISNTGAVVGFSKNSNSDITPTLWPGGSSAGTDLGVPVGYVTAKAFAVNAAGAVAGEAVNGSGLKRAVRYQGTWSALDLVSGHPETTVHDIAETGFVAGAGFTSNSTQVAAYWDDAGKAINLGMLSGDTYSIAWGMNSFGWVVGESGNPTAQTQRVFIYRPGIGMQDLNTMVSGFTFFIGYGINETGDIVGLGLNANNEYSAFIVKRTDVDIVPATYQYVRGVPGAGNTIGQLFFPDNSRQTAKRGFVANASESPIQLNVTGISPDLTPTAISVQVKAQVDSPGLRETLELLNYQTNAYETVGTPLGGSVNSDRITIASATGTLSRFVKQSGANTGQVTAKLSYKAVGPVAISNWGAKIDQLIITIEP